MKSVACKTILAAMSAVVMTGCSCFNGAGRAKENPLSAPIVYFDIAGPDGAKLKDFYSAALGWSINPDLTIPAASTGGLKGTIRQDPAAKVLYFGVPDINKALKRIEADGGKTMVPRTMVPGVVTFAIFTDPAGNVQGLAEFGSYPK